MLEKLNQYRDIITLVVFFLGGLFWIQKHFATFATKDDIAVQNAALSCLIQANLRLTELELKRTDLENQLAHDLQEIAALKPSAPQVTLSDFAQEELAAAQGRQSDDSSDLKQTLAQIQGITDSLGAQKCPTG